MNYNVGDLVKVKSDLKAEKCYKGLYFAREMEKFNGKTYRIRECCYEHDNYYLEGILVWKFNDEMLEPIEEINNEEINKFQYGDKVRVIKNGKCGIIKNLNNIIPDYTENGILNQNYRVEYIGNNIGDYDYYGCLELRLIERNVPNLDEEEKKYLNGIIKPFKKYVNFIEKLNYIEGEEEYIIIKINKNGRMETITLPCFKINSMYKNMKINKKYNLKELDLI